MMLVLEYTVLYVITIALNYVVDLSIVEMFIKSKISFESVHADNHTLDNV